MSTEGLIDVYDPLIRLKGETIVCVARQIDLVVAEAGRYTTARPCCRAKARSDEKNAYAIVTRPARVRKDAADPQLQRTELLEMLKKKLIGEILVTEGVTHSKKHKVDLSHTHHGFQMETYGDENHLAFAVIVRAAKVHNYRVKRETGKAPPSF